MAIIQSRSAREFMRRTGMIETPRIVQPRLQPGELRINRIPLRRDQLVGTYMTDADGAPPPDRGITDQWPPSQEVQSDGT